MILQLCIAARMSVCEFGLVWANWLVDQIVADVSQLLVIFSRFIAHQSGCIQMSTSHHFQLIAYRILLFADEFRMNDVLSGSRLWTNVLKEDVRSVAMVSRQSRLGRCFDVKLV